MAKTGWTKELPQQQGWYWVRSGPHGLPAAVEFFPALMDRRKPSVRYPGKDGFMVVLASDADAEWLGPISPSDAEQLTELRRIERELNEAHIPKEVWIGTDSTADRVTWLITRNRLNQQNSHSRFKAVSGLADLVEEMLTRGDPSDSWWERAEEALIAAGRRQVASASTGAVLTPQEAKETE